MIQTSKGKRGGKGGETYGDAGKDNPDRWKRAKEETGIEIKGHVKGRPGSHESSQTKHERAKVVEKDRELKAKDKTQKKCDQYHKNKRNVGRRCPECHQKVVEED